jgi:hypothetical protein
MTEGLRQDYIEKIAEHKRILASHEQSWDEGILKLRQIEAEREAAGITTYNYAPTDGQNRRLSGIWSCIRNHREYIELYEEILASA